MTITIETFLIVAMAFAVFAAVTALGSSLVLGIGFERLRAGFEVVKKQTAFFSSSIHDLDKRVDSVEKQGRYFFETIHALEEKTAEPKADEAGADIAEQAESGVTAPEPALLRASKNDVEKVPAHASDFWGEPEDSKVMRFH